MNLVDRLERMKAWWKRLIFTLKKDREARNAARPIVLGVMTALVLAVVGPGMVLAPQQKRMNRLKKECSRLQAEALAVVPQGTISNLEKTASSLKASLEEKKIKKTILSLDLAGSADPDRFRRLILGLYPGTAKGIEQGLIRVTSQSQDQNSTITQVEGTLPFDTLYRYLDFLEHRMEVYSMDGLVIKAQPCRDDGEAGERGEALCFTLRVGRLKSSQEAGG